MFRFRTSHVSAALPVAVIFAMTLALPASAPAHEDDHTPASHHAHDPGDVWAIARGGQLYDNWMSTIEADEPKQTHPAYPAKGKKKGAATWRCKECHGWDYRGAKGAYASGSHFTGIKGVRRMARKKPNSIHKIIMDKTHGFTATQMPHSAMEKLALFLSKGQVDMDRYIERRTRKARGDTNRGAAAYQTICAVCHGFDGKQINFKSEKKPEYIGTVCSKNPWEALHKIRFGQPGVGMVAMISLGIQYQVDILTYCQGLPVK